MSSENVSQRVIQSILGYYSDISCKNKMPRDNSGHLQLNFGKIIMGKISKVITMYLRNEHVFPIGLEAKATDPDLLFLTYPKQLSPGEVGKTDIAFRCPMSRIRPLDANWGFDLTILPNQ